MEITISQEAYERHKAKRQDAIMQHLKPKEPGALDSSPLDDLTENSEYQETLVAISRLE